MCGKGAGGGRSNRYESLFCPTLMLSVAQCCSSSEHAPSHVCVSVCNERERVQGGRQPAAYTIHDDSNINTNLMPALRRLLQYHVIASNSKVLRSIVVGIYFHHREAVEFPVLKLSLMSCFDNNK